MEEEEEGFIINVNKIALALDGVSIALQQISEKNEEIKNLSIEVVQLDVNQEATVNYDVSTGKMTFGISKGIKGDIGNQGNQGDQGPKGDTGDTGNQGPKGDTGDTGNQGLKGDRGESFEVDATGTLINKSNYDEANQGFAYLSLDESPTKVYFKKSNTVADWTEGVPFGKGDTGNIGDTGADGVGISNVNRTAGDGSAGSTDTYTITLTDNTTKTFTVTHGSDLTNSQIINDTASSTNTAYSSSKMDDLMLDIELGIPT